MNYGFVIDSRKCIGCHACTVACKSENEVPLGVNRTWVKYVERGKFPDVRRYFTVMRCNHCEEPPCVYICPVEALQQRDDGIVDFDGRRCIGCKACAQACPYNSVYIDPDTQTTAKCNYCAHRMELSLKPACEVICPQEAIVSGDLDDLDSDISKLISTQQTSVRKAEKSTRPNVFYINGDGPSLNPLNIKTDGQYLWSEQSRGVGHFVNKRHAGNGRHKNGLASANKHTETYNVYDTPSKGVVWGWEVPAYIWTKAISSGVILALFLITSFFSVSFSEIVQWSVLGTSLVFLALTGLFLVKDLDRPDRFSSVMLRPQFKSWLVKGGYTISAYGLFLALWGASKLLNLSWLEPLALAGSAIIAVVIAVYTAFLFGSAKGRDFWQSPLLAFHMFVTSVVIGGAVMVIVLSVTGANSEALSLLKWGLVGGLIINLLSMVIEVFNEHPSKQAEETAKLITDGELKQQFWFGSLVLGHLLPVVLLLSFSNMAALMAAAVLILIGAWITEKIWVKAPQLISLS